MRGSSKVFHWYTKLSVILWRYYTKCDRAVWLQDCTSSSNGMIYGTKVLTNIVSWPATSEHSLLDQNHVWQGSSKIIHWFTVLYVILWRVIWKVWCNILIDWYDSATFLIPRCTQGVAKMLSPAHCIYLSSIGSKTWLMRLEKAIFWYTVLSKMLWMYHATCVVSLQLQHCSLISCLEDMVLSRYWESGVPSCICTPSLRSNYI